MTPATYEELRDDSSDHLAFIDHTSGALRPDTYLNGLTAPHIELLTNDLKSGIISAGNLHR